MHPTCLHRYIFIIALAGLGISLKAQTAKLPSPAEEETPVELTAFVITGSSLPTAADRADVPVAVIGSQDLQNTGMNSNLLEILRKRIPASAGAAMLAIATRPIPIKTRRAVLS